MTERNVFNLATLLRIVSVPEFAIELHRAVAVSGSRLLATYRSADLLSGSPPEMFGRPFRADSIGR
jgi:hypothetical protein